MNQTLTPKKIKSLVNHIYRLPTLPTTVAQLIELIDKPGTSARQLGRMISGDQVLTAQVLKLANSAYYGFPRQIRTIPLAIVILGFETLKNMLLGVSIIDQFSRFTNGLRFDFSLFWQHTLGTAVASRLIARDVGLPLAGEAFVAGLLHDLGKLVLSQYFSEEFYRIYLLSFQTREPMYYMEKKNLKGVTHAEVGAWLAERWNLPGNLIQGVRYHHEPGAAPKTSELAALVHLSDFLIRRRNFGFSGDLSRPHLDEHVPDILNLPGDLKSNSLALREYEHYFTQKLEREYMLFGLIGKPAKNNQPESDRENRNTRVRAV